MAKRMAALDGRLFELCISMPAACLWALGHALGADPGAQPTVIERQILLRQPAPGDRGGVFAHDVNDDNRLDLVVTSEGHIGAYDLSGDALWVLATDIALFDSYHHPSAVAGDLDGDGRQEVAHLTASGQIAILEGATGTFQKTLKPPAAPLAIAVANLRGEGDQDILLQFSQTHIAAIRADTG